MNAIAECKRKKIKLEKVEMVPKKINIAKALVMTPLSALWRTGVEVCDVYAIRRYLDNKPTIDVAFVTNMRDHIDRTTFLGTYRPKSGYFTGPHFVLNGDILGRTIALDITANDLKTEEGRLKARRYFIAAVAYAQEKGAKGCLLAAGTKKLFDDEKNGNGYILKTLFPDMFFTLGDNGTSLLLIKETLRALKKANLKPENSKIAILGAYGLLGEMNTKILADKRYSLIGVGRDPAKNKILKDKYGINICSELEQVGKVDAVIACTHGDSVCITADNLDLLRKPNKKLLVIDVAEPSNFKKDEYDKVKDLVVRQDAGNAYNEGLTYILGPISYKMFRLYRGVQFGCFAEAMSLFSALKRGEDLTKIDLFGVNMSTMKIVQEFFRKDGYTIPSPRSHGRAVKTFDLDLDL